MAKRFLERVQEIVDTLLKKIEERQVFILLSSASNEI